MEIFHPLRKNLLTTKPTIRGITEALASGVDPNTMNKYNESALFYTTADYDIGVEASDYYIMTGLLLESDANPNLQNIIGDTPLINAIRSGSGDPKYNDIAKLLIEEGKADIFMKSDNYEQGEEDMSPLDIALKYNNIEMVKYINDILLIKPKQNLAPTTSMIPRLGYDSTLGYIDEPSIFEIIASYIPEYSRYAPDISRRIRDEYRRDPLTKSKQRLATIKGTRDNHSVLQYLREPELMKNVESYLTSMRPYPSVHSRMNAEERVNPYTELLQDYGQYGSGKLSKKKTFRKKRKGKYFV